MKIEFEQTFSVALRKLPPDRQDAVKRAIKKLQEDLRLPALRFRPLKGCTAVFVINARRGDRIILRKLGADHFAVVDCGPHDNVYRVWDR